MKEGIKDIIARYLLMIAIGILGVFYAVFKPLTVYSAYFILNLFYQATLSGAVLTVNSMDIEIIDACIASSAYFLLFILNFSTRKIRFDKRILVFFIDSGIFLVFNVLRIVGMSVLLIKGSIFFETVHLIFWYAVSVLAVFLIWILTAKIFDIKEIPFVSDFLYVRKMLRKKTKK